MMKRSPGFSLIELIVVVAIIAILTMVAYPSYLNYIKKTRRAEGIALINKVMQAEERYFVNNSPPTYTDKLTDLGFSVDSDLPTENGYYQVNAEACGDGIADCVNIVATAAGSQATDGNLEYNSRGEKKWAGNSGWDWH